MNCLINEQECFIRYKDTRRLAECFIHDKIRTASLLNGFKNEPFRKFIDVKIHSRIYSVSDIPSGTSDISIIILHITSDTRAIIKSTIYIYLNWLLLFQAESNGRDK